MAENTKIEWCEATWNPLAGCSIVSPGCHNCYAMRTAHRLAAMGQEKYQGVTEKKNGRILWTGKINLDEKALLIPLKKKKPTTWFVNSMSDLFHESVPFKFIDKVFAVMALAERHTFQVLTKRAERMAEYLADRQSGPACEVAAQTRVACWAESIAKDRGEDTSSPWWDVWLEQWPLKNVWLGTSCEDQQRADERIPHLLNCPAAVRFLSCEPLLGPIDLEDVFNKFGIAEDDTLNGITDIDWVIVGGESGPGARPMHPDWVRSIRDQCVEAGVSFFFKQWGEFLPYSQAWSEEQRVAFLGMKDSQRRRIGSVFEKSPYRDEALYRVGKKKAGRLLDSREWNELPHTVT